MDLQEISFISLMGGYGFGALIGLAFLKSSRITGVWKNVSFASALLASLAGCLFSLSILLTGTTFHLELANGLPFGAFAFHVDQLSAFFLGVITLLSLSVSVYSFGYTTEFVGRRNVHLLAALYNLFLLSMVMVVTAANVILFLIVWELMSLTTYFLITYEHEDQASRRAGILYVVMTHIGTAFLVVMFLLLASQMHSFNFVDFQNASAQLPVSLKTWIFLCAVIGFGTKSGIIPLHIWLPEAHPAAPSNVSALMSGVMIKTGIYGMVRVFFDFLGSGPAWWGILILTIAVASAVLGVLYALMEHDLKRLLAFHSIENIGIILMGIGAALLFVSFGNKTLAALALIAALYHVLNHATFKGLLFLGAGSVVHATHTKNIEELGGLIRKLPWTSFFFLIGSVAICALPPFNGFVSEWLTFQALLLGFNIPDLAVKLAMLLTVALLALTGALAAACFVKAFGITYLGVPRSSHAETAHESSFTMLAAMGVLALACLVLGVFPRTIVSLLAPISSQLFSDPVSAITLLSTGGLTVPLTAGSGISPLVIAAFFVGLLLVPLLVGVFVGGKLRKRTAMVWACGLEHVDPRMQYSATGFSKPIRMIFSTIYRATREIEVSEESSAYYTPRIRYELKTESIFEKYLYAPVQEIIVNASQIVRKIQTGHVQSYLMYIFITLVLLLVFAR